MGIASGIYKTGLSVRKFLYKKGIKKIRRLPVRVISIGNITLGGTGKTPAVIAIAQEAKKRGFKPCILTRGYRGRAKEPCLVQSIEVRSQKSEDKKLRRWEGDEPVLMTERLEDVPVVKCTDRYEGGLFALNSSLVTRHPVPCGSGPHSSPLFILDDGFQHLRLYRDIDILLVDAITPFGNEKLFPEGILREPLDEIKRADIIILTKSEMADRETLRKLTEKINQYQRFVPNNTEATIYTASHKPSALIAADGRTRGLESIKDKKVYAFAGIANPSHFLSTLKSQGAEVTGFRKFSDHYFYKAKDIKKIKEDAGALDIITTEKDLVKLKELGIHNNIFALRIEFSINENNSFYDSLFKEHPKK